MASEDTIQKVFNQDLLNNEDFLRIIRELISDLEKRPGIPADMVAQELKQKFKLKDIPSLDLSKNLWHQCTDNIPNFEGMPQGYRITIKEGGKKVKIPLLAYTVDLEHGEDIIKKIVENYNKIK